MIAATKLYTQEDSPFKISTFLPVKFGPNVRSSDLFISSRQGHKTQDNYWLPIKMVKMVRLGIIIHNQAVQSQVTCEAAEIFIFQTVIVFCICWEAGKFYLTNLRH